MKLPPFVSSLTLIFGLSCDLSWLGPYMSVSLAFLVDFSIATSLIALFNLSSQKRSFLLAIIAVTCSMMATVTRKSGF
jgi:hypothetical protein